MRYELIIRARAEQHTIKTFRWYEEKRTGLGEEFLIAVEACLDKIKRNPYLYQKRYKKVRIGFVKRFPYGIYYFIDEKKIVVTAILHLKRGPNTVRKMTG